MFEKPKMLFEKLDTSTLGCFDTDFSVLQEKIRFLFDVLLLERLTLHRRAIFHSKHESSVELLKIHGTMFGEEQDSSHASKIYLG